MRSIVHVLLSRFALAGQRFTRSGSCCIAGFRRRTAGHFCATCLAVLLTGAHVPAGAQPRPQQRLTTRMTCADAKALVKQDGDVTLGTGSGAPERLVADRGYCEIAEIAELRFVPTRDNPQCPVGYRCKAPDFEDWNWK